MTALATLEHVRAYRALARAAERIGASSYAEQRASHLRRGRSRRTFRFAPTQGHRELVEALADLGRGRISPDEAMAHLHYGESAHALELARASH